MNQGKDEPIREWIHIGDYVALKRCFFSLAYIIGDSKVRTKCVEDIWLMQMCQGCVEHVMFLQKTVTIHITVATLFP